MRGLIGKKDILRHPIIAIQGYGWQTFYDVLKAPKETTFLEVLSKNIPPILEPVQKQVTDQLNVLIHFESQISSIYFNLMEKFTHIPEVRKFFKTLSYQEEAHSEILRIVKVEVARLNLWNNVKLLEQDKLDPATKLIQSIQHQLSQPALVSLEKALIFVDKLEKMEDDLIFPFLHRFYKAVQTPFLKRIDRIIPSFANHHEYLNSELPYLKEAIKTYQKR